MRRSTLITFAAAAAITAAFFAGNTVARPERAGPSNNIATVNIQNVFDALQERKDKLTQLQNEANELEGKFNAINRNIAAARDEANKIADPAAREAALDAVVDRDVQANIDIKKAKAKLEKSQAATIKLIFEHIQSAAKVSAAKNGFTMVMCSDDTVQISPRATAAEASQMMGLRRFLYIDKSHDITQSIIDSMNADYAASKPAATPPAPAAGGNPAPAAPAAPATTPAH